MMLLFVSVVYEKTAVPFETTVGRRSLRHKDAVCLISLHFACFPSRALLYDLAPLPTGSARYVM